MTYSDLVRFMHYPSRSLTVFTTSIQATGWRKCYRLKNIEVFDEQICQCAKDIANL